MNWQSQNNNRRVRWRRLSRWKNVLNNNYKNNNGRNFQFTKSSFIDLVLTDRRRLHVNGQNWPVANLPVVDFHSQRTEMLTPKPLNTQLSVFLLLYWFSTLSRKVWTSLPVSDTDFFSVLAAIIRESSDKQLVLRIVKALPFIHQPDRVAPKASDVSAADWLYQHTWKNTIFFHVCCCGFSQGRKSLYNTAVRVIKRVFFWFDGHHGGKMQGSS